MDITTILIALGIIITLIIIGKIFSILTKVLLTVIIIAILVLGFFIWQNGGKLEIPQIKMSSISVIM